MHEGKREPKYPLPHLHHCLIKLALGPCCSFSFRHYKKIPKAKYQARVTPFWIGWEVCLCLLMLASLAIWFWYAIQLVQEDVFHTMWVQKDDMQPFKGHDCVSM